MQYSFSLNGQIEILKSMTTKKSTWKSHVKEVKAMEKRRTAGSNRESAIAKCALPASAFNFGKF